MTEAMRVGVIGIGRDEIVEILDATPGIEPVATSDIDAATRLLSGELAYIVGVCESGGGAALAIPIALLGADRCTNLSKLGRPVPEADLPGVLDSGVRAFGVARDHIPALVPALVHAAAERPIPARG